MLLVFVLPPTLRAVFEIIKEDSFEAQAERNDKRMMELTNGKWPA